MRYFPEDIKEFENLNAEQWQKDLLKLNHSYNAWGNFEDYMSGDDAGWRSRSNLDSFDQMWGLDDLNEVVNFYFELYRPNQECEHCEGEGLNPETKQISDEWYDFKKTGKRWCNSITQDEVEALVRGGRIRSLVEKNCYFNEDEGKWYEWKNGVKVETSKPNIPTAEDVNKWNSGKGFGHDAINRWICIKQRAKRLGVYGKCEHCNDGYIYTEPKAKVALQLWLLHPRKGCSKGVYISEIKFEDLPKVFDFLKEAAKRNQDRFQKAIDFQVPELV